MSCMTSRSWLWFGILVRQVLMYNAMRGSGVSGVSLEFSGGRRWSGIGNIGGIEIANEPDMSMLFVLELNTFGKENELRYHMPQ